MITEDYCSYEVAKLLKEKFKDYKFLALIYDETVGDVIETCTHQMALKLLREKCKIDIFISTDYPIDRMKYTYKIVRVYKDGDKYTDVMGGSYDTYEEAVEAALKHSLTKLI